MLMLYEGSDSTEKKTYYSCGIVSKIVIHCKKAVVIHFATYIVEVPYSYTIYRSSVIRNIYEAIFDMIDNEDTMSSEEFVKKISAIL